MKPVFLRVEYQENPLGIDTPAPRMSWTLESDAPNARQTAYRVLAASGPEILSRNEGDLWDSGRVESAVSAHIAYEGAPLAARRSCWWKARVWDQDGNEGPWSEPGSWTMGLLAPNDWTGQWIGYEGTHPARAAEPPAPLLDGLGWMSLPGTEKKGYGNLPPRVYRTTLTLPLKPVDQAFYAGVSAGQYTLHVNGKAAGTSDGRYWAWIRPSMIDVKDALQPGENVVGIHATHVNTPQPPGVLGVLEVRYSDGTVDRFPVDETWKGRAEPGDDWLSPASGGEGWESLVRIGEKDDAPWGRIAPVNPELPPCPHLRTTFETPRPVKRALLYAAAYGVYDIHLNGARVNDDLLSPGWTDYEHRVYYRAYDVTPHVRAGRNAWGILLGHGWYSGYIGWDPNSREWHNDEPRVMAQIELTYEDGSRQIVATGPNWQAAFGAIVGSDIYQGETADARHAPRGWDTPEFDARGWKPVLTGVNHDLPVQRHPGPPVRFTQELAPVAVTQPVPGVHVFDMGQNMVGVVRMRVRGPAGTKVRLRFAEMLQEDGTLYVENLRNARVIDEYILAGEGDEVFEPRFTFHGFRYVELTGYPGKPDAGAVTGLVMHSDMRQTGEFACSHDLLNQLQHNIVWGQKGNFLEVPTDCPQRDERLGWMGDAQVFAATACFNFDTAAFFTKWMRDVEDGQFESGAYPDVAPRIVADREGAPAWGDAGVIVPWTAWQWYGDTRMIDRHFDSMRRWIAYCGKDNPRHVRRRNLNNNYGDWLNKDDNTPKDLIATAYYAYSTQRLAEMAEATGRDAEAKELRELRAAIAEAFVKYYVEDDGRVKGDTQTCYVLALHFGLLPEALRAPTAARLVQRIHDANDHLTTGFVGVSYLCPTLEEIGELDLAYKLLTNTTYPSWLYSVTQGATTIWERWDGWTEHAGFQDPGMNSFNHYAYGSIGAWMYATVAGLRHTAPGFRTFRVRPRPGAVFSHARAAFDSISGRIETNWEIANDNFTLSVTVPPNTSAEVLLPAPDGARVNLEGDAQAAGREGDALVFRAGAGAYRFTAPWG